MKIEWTEQAQRGWREVAAYIQKEFGRQGYKQFKQRTKENEAYISKFPNGSEIAWVDAETGIEYRWRTIYHRSKVLYFIREEKVMIADFWDVRTSQ